MHLAVKYVVTLHIHVYTATLMGDFAVLFVCAIFTANEAHATSSERSQLEC